jgi:hypothetical protein
MGIHYTTKVEGEILFVHAAGFDESPEDVRNYAMGVLSAGLESGVTRVLCDETELEYRLGIFDTYEAGKFLSENVPAIVKVAIVCNSVAHPDTRFFEDVVVNRGLSLRFFPDNESAREWLMVSDTGSGAGAGF